MTHDGFIVYRDPRFDKVIVSSDRRTSTKPYKGKERRHEL